MKHIQTKKIFEEEHNESTDPFEDLYNLSTSLIYNLSLFKNKYETNLDVKFSDDDGDLNGHLYSQIKEVVSNLELLLDAVKSIRNELHL